MHESQRRLCFKGVLLLITLRQDPQQNVDTSSRHPDRAGNERRGDCQSSDAANGPRTKGASPGPLALTAALAILGSLRKHWKIAAECALYLGKTI